MIENKEKFKELAEKYGINAIFLFGSQARGDVHVGSDFDFAIQFSEDVEEDEYFDLKLQIISEFTKIVNNNRVDVVILNGLESGLSLKFRAIKEGQILYEKNEIMRGRMETKIMSYYFDRQYYSKRYIKESLAFIAQN